MRRANVARTPANQQKFEAKQAAVPVQALDAHDAM
jgi:hypothetical protein